MLNLIAKHAEAYSLETFHCGNCRRDFEAKVVTWVDVTKIPQAKAALQKWEFNEVQCTHCGCGSFSGTPFFYEDFEEGLLVAVFPGIPEKRGEVEKTIEAKYGYYPVLEFFYDMTQIWMLVYLQNHYKTNTNLLALSRIGRGEKRLRKILRFLKEDAMMIDIREKLTESLFGSATHDELAEVLDQAVYTLEEMLPWPLNAQCLCGADLSREFICCGKPINIREHDRMLSRQYAIYCPACNRSISGASCEKCGRVYTWKLGTIPTYQQQTGSAPLTSPHDAQKTDVRL
jgi:hypothetical protein